MENDIIVALDIGTCFIRVAVGEVLEGIEEGEQTLEILCVEERQSLGIRNGTIVNIEKVSSVISEILEEASEKTSCRISSVVTGIGGRAVKSQNGSGGVAIKKAGEDKSREINEDDLDRVFEAATAVQMQAATEKIHIIAQEYKVIPEGMVEPICTKSPLHMEAVRLDVKVHIVTASGTILSSVEKCLNRVGVQLEQVMLKTLAISEMVMRPDEKENGSILIDLGGGSTDVMVIINDAPICTASVEIGQKLVTNDIAVVLGITPLQAEAVKLKYGSCWQEDDDEDCEIVVEGTGSADPVQFTKSELCNIIQSRMEEIFSLAFEKISSRAGVSQLLGNIILTGGGARMNGVEELAKSVFGTSAVRIGKPDDFGGDQKKYRSPEWATVIGLVVANKKLVFSSDSKSRRKKHPRDEKKGGRGFFKRLKDAFF